MATSCTHTTLLLIAAALTATTCARRISDRLQEGGAIPEILQRLGLQREGMDTLEVSVGPYNKGESPIYYIKLPPSPYFFKHHRRPHPYTEAPAKNSNQPKPTKIDVNFISNGKPTQLHHWNLPITSASQVFETLKKPPSDPPSTTPAPISTTTTTPPPTTTSPKTTTRSTTQVTTKPAQSPTQSPTIPNSFWPTPKVPHVLKKKYYYNGKPSSVYVWRPKKIPAASARHPYFQHFNY